jgi:hypothetical protein
LFSSLKTILNTSKALKAFIIHLFRIYCDGIIENPNLFVRLTKHGSTINLLSQTCDKCKYWNNQPHQTVQYDHFVDWKIGEYHQHVHQHFFETLLVKIHAKNWKKMFLYKL